MRLIFQLLILSAVLLASCSKTPAEVQPSLMEASKQELASAIAERDELLKLVTEITSLMTEIKRVEHIISSPSTGESDRRRLIGDLKALQNRLDSRRKELSELDSRLKESSLVSDDMSEAIKSLYREIDSQSSTIAKLRKHLSEANARIESLHQEVDSLNSAIETSSQERDEAKAHSDELETRLNTCYYIVASKRELKKHHIIESSFLRKQKLMEGDFDKDCFTMADKTDLVAIPLPTDHSKLLSKHPKDTYELLNYNGEGKLLILNTERFWCFSNYLVIQTD